MRPPVLPELLGSEMRALIREKLDEKELQLIALRKRKSIGVLGWDKVVQQNFLMIPGRGEEMFGTVPSYSASSTWKRIEAAQRRRSLIDAYKAALVRFIAGDVLFPEGTWLAAPLRLRVLSVASLTTLRKTQNAGGGFETRLLVLVSRAQAGVGLRRNDVHLSRRGMLNTASAGTTRPRGRHVEPLAAEPSRTSGLVLPQHRTRHHLHLA